MNARLSLAATQAPGEPSEAQQKARLAALLLELARCVDPNVAASEPSRLEDDPRLDAMRRVLLERERLTIFISTA